MKKKQQFKSDKKILYLLPSPSMEGGMTITTHMFYEVGLFNNPNIKHFNTSFTWSDNNLIRILQSFLLKIQFIFKLIYFRPHAIFVIASPYWGYYDKIFYCFIAKLFGIKSYFNNVSGGFVHFYEKNNWNKFLIKNTINIPSAVVLGTPFWTTYFKSNFPKLNTIEIANPVICDNFCVAKSNDLKHDKIKIVSAFRITKDKGVVELVEVIKQVCQQTDQFEFTILGDGSEYAWMCNELSELSKKGLVHIKGFLEGDAKVKEIVNADAYLMLTHYDMMPIAILEAMSAGLPIFSTRVGGIPDMVEEGQNAILFDLHQTNEVTNTLLQFVGKKPQLKQMGEISRNIAKKKYNIEQIINQQLHVINKDNKPTYLNLTYLLMTFWTNLIFQLQGLPIRKAVKDLARILNLQPVEKAKWIEEKKWEIVSYHYKNNPLYKKLIGNKIPSDWNDLPKITKKHLQGELSELLSTPFNKKDVYIGNTSGSSGHPFYFAKDKYTHALTWAYIRKVYADYQISPYDLQARFYGIPLEKWSYRKEKLKDFILRRERFSVFDLSDENIERYIEVFKRKKFKYIYGYTNSIVLFSRYLIKNNISLHTLCPSLKLCIVTSELCTDEDKEIITQALGVPVVREYGASELCLIAFDQPKGGWLINNSTILVETEEKNGIGKIYCTSLFNKAYPMIRYEIGDIGEIVEDNEGNQYLKELLGRTNDNILLPSGKVSPGLTFYYISRSILESSGILKEFIIKQIAIDEFVFEVVSEQELSDNILAEIKTKAELYLEKGLKINIVRKEFIDRPASGKIKHFYSLIN